MITRELQISQLACAIFNQHIDIDECITLARNYILEAERRAEQRVRAEIGRASERLDWIGTQDVVIVQGNGTDWSEVLLARYQRTLPTDLVDIRETIDAAREVG